MLTLATTLASSIISSAAAQQLTILHEFSGSDGAFPGPMSLCGGILYGKTSMYGAGGEGTVFAINPDGTGFREVLNLGTPIGNGEVVLSGSTLYGTDDAGGDMGFGSIFKVNLDGTGFGTLYNFEGAFDGAFPTCLLLLGTTLYGTGGQSVYGGPSGMLFRLNLDGTGYSILHGFGSDGKWPNGVILSRDSFYGTANYGGAWNNGTIFSINTNGSNSKVLYSFSGTNDGGYPVGLLLLRSNMLFGTTSTGGDFTNGTVFAINTDGTGFRTLHSFTGGSDGGIPAAGLTLCGEKIYGTTTAGGLLGSGTLFSLNGSGTEFATLASFPAGVPPSYPSPVPWGALISFSNTLYGTSLYGGSYGSGMVFSFAIPAPVLTIVASGTNAVLMWPADAAGFGLLTASNLVPPVVWSSVSQIPVVVNGQNTVTNPISGTQQFFRLTQ